MPSDSAAFDRKERGMRYLLAALMTVGIVLGTLLIIQMIRVLGRNRPPDNR
jgi:hypothetical protein